MKLPDFENKLEKRVSFFKTQLAGLRVGGLNLDNIGALKVNVYGSSLTLREVANLTAISSLEVTVSPWDKTVLPDIEKSLREVDNAGFSVVADSDILRLKASELTQERRVSLIKEISRLKEDAKVAIRLVRQDQMKSLEEMEETGELSEDELYRQKEEAEKIVREANKKIDQLAEAKQQRLATI